MLMPWAPHNLLKGGKQMTPDLDFTSPSVAFSYDVNNSLLYKKDDRNYVNILSRKQLNTLGNTSLLDIFLSTGNVIEPHYHQNASELVYCVTGAAVVSIINPFTNQLHHYPITPGLTANIPQGWWHYEIATVDNTHLLAIFDAPIPEVIFGSDILRLTPADILAHTYCLDEAMVKETLAPITGQVFIGPPAGCDNALAEENMPTQPAAMHQMAYGQGQGQGVYQGSGQGYQGPGQGVYQGQGSYPGQGYASQSYVYPQQNGYPASGGGYASGGYQPTGYQPWIPQNGYVQAGYTQNSYAQAGYAAAEQSGASYTGTGYTPAGYGNGYPPLG
jgi:oxalate decarboxylase/phosphoglucose isomerase-like protein (cupin superfamily)